MELHIEAVLRQKTRSLYAPESLCQLFALPGSKVAVLKSKRLGRKEYIACETLPCTTAIISPQNFPMRPTIHDNVVHRNQSNMMIRSDRRNS